MRATSLIRLGRSVARFLRPGVGPLLLFLDVFVLSLRPFWLPLSDAAGLGVPVGFWELGRQCRRLFGRRGTGRGLVGGVLGVLWRCRFRGQVGSGQGLLKGVIVLRGLLWVRRGMRVGWMRLK